jgi:hypothetical protein
VAEHIDLEAAAAAVEAQLDQQEWNMQEIERIQQEQVCRALSQKPTSDTCRSLDPTLLGGSTEHDIRQLRTLICKVLRHSSADADCCELVAGVHAVIIVGTNFEESRH